MVQTAPMISPLPNSTPPDDKRIRLTVSLPVRVHAAFERLAKASNSSISREVGTFLDDCIDAVEFVAHTVVQARQAPAKAARDLHAYAQAVTDEAAELVAQSRRRPVPPASDASASVRAVPGSAGLKPPSSLTGVKESRRKRKP